MDKCNVLYLICRACSRFSTNPNWINHIKTAVEALGSTLTPIRLLKFFQVLVMLHILFGSFHTWANQKVLSWPKNLQGFAQVWKVSPYPGAAEQSGLCCTMKRDWHALHEPLGVCTWYESTFKLNNVIGWMCHIMSCISTWTVNPDRQKEGCRRLQVRQNLSNTNDYAL